MEVTINTENLNEKDLVLLNEIFKRSEEKQKWKPQKHKKYYFITSTGNIDSENWVDDEVDNVRWVIGNTFNTIEEAQFAVEKLKVTAELKRYAMKYDDEINWKYGDSYKWCILYNYGKEEIMIGSYHNIQHREIYFSSKELAESALNEIGVERIKKYYLNVREH